MDRELVETALRVLNACVSRAAGKREDRDLPLNDLATRVVDRELEKVRTLRAPAAG